jgi:hypothetical protein
VTNEENLIVVDLWRGNPHRGFTIILSMSSPNLERIFDKILYEVDSSDIP